MNKLPNKLSVNKTFKNYFIVLNTLSKGAVTISYFLSLEHN